MLINIILGTPQILDSPYRLSNLLRFLYKVSRSEISIEVLE